MQKNDSSHREVKRKKRPCFDILMGVGAKYYPDPSFFIEEVLRLGLSKRLPDIPEFFDPQKNALFLVHWGTRKIFGFVIGLKIRIFAEEDSKECKEAKKKYGENNVICAPLGALPNDFAERGCGRLKGGGKYVKQI